MTMNAYIKYCLVALLANVLFSSCDDTNNHWGGQPSLNYHHLYVSESTVNLAASDTEQTITVSAADVTPWRFEDYDASWLTITPSSGIGEATVTVHAAANQAIEERTTTASLVSTDPEYNRSFSIVITQLSMIDVTGLCIDAYHPHTVDMGDGLKWSCCNVGAQSPIEYGDYFAWGETTTKYTYDWSTYKYCKGSYDTMTKYCNSSSYGTVDNKTQLELSDDAARANWGGTWRMPTIDELSTLNSNCTWTWTTINEVKGYKVTAKNGNVLFLPAAGYRGKILFSAGYYGQYWSSSLNTSNAGSGRNLDFNSSRHDTGYSYSSSRFDGQSVRPVTE